MASNVLGTRPKSSAEELRFDSAAPCRAQFERSKLICKVVAPAAVALVLVRLAIPTNFAPLGETLFSLTSVVGVSAFAVLASLANFWSSRVHRDECCDRYARYIGSKA